MITLFGEGGAGGFTDGISAYFVRGQTFENVYAYEWFVGAYGVIYLITMDKDTASLYKIDAGYTKN